MVLGVEGEDYLRFVVEVSGEFYILDENCIGFTFFAVDNPDLEGKAAGECKVDFFHFDGVFIGSESEDGVSIEVGEFPDNLLFERVYVGYPIFFEESDGGAAIVEGVEVLYLGFEVPGSV